MSLEFRFFIEDGSQTVLWVGLAESLNQVNPVNGGDIPGVFIAPNHLNHIEFLSLYPNRDYTFYDTALNYGGYGKWIKAKLTINGLSVIMEIWDDNGNLLGLDEGVLYLEYSSYNSLMLMFDYGGEYANTAGYLDDIKVCDLANQ